MRQFVGHTGAVSGVAYAPDGKTALTSSYDGTVRLLDTATLQEIRQFSAGTREVLAAALSPDGKSILTASADGTARYGKPARAANWCNSGATPTL